jgi:hypothetical protein
MNLSEWLNVIPSAMSAIAAVAAAYAAFVALRVSREANSLSEKSILSVYHHDAASALANSIERLRKETKDLSEFSYDLWADWSREIESKDEYSKGGSNPRPLRHVLSNGSEMLMAHATRNGSQYRNATRSMFSIIREGISELNEPEYKRLLKKVDSTYLDFESTLDSPPLNKSIGNADAFRWVCYQLAKRVDCKGWNEIWRDAWRAEGRLIRYQIEFSKVKSVLEVLLESLQAEKNRIAFSVLPIHENSELNKKYEMVLSGLEVLLEDCSLESLEPYLNWKYDEDIPQLILYTMGVACLVRKILDSICLADEMDL